MDCDCKARIDKLKGEIALLHTFLDEQDDEIEALAVTIEDLRQEADDWAEDYGTLEAILDAREEELDRKNALIAALKAVIACQDDD
jgi:chromosome segregation ATPase